MHEKAADVQVVEVTDESYELWTWLWKVLTRRKRSVRSFSRCDNSDQMSTTFLTFDFDKLLIPLTPKFELVTIGFMLGLTVAFVVVVDGTTRFFVLLPVWMGSLMGFFAFCVVAGALRVVGAFLVVATSAGDADTSRLCWRFRCRCSCSLTRSRVRTSRTIRDTTSSSQILGSDDMSISASLSSDCDDKVTKWSTNMNFTTFFTHIFTSDYFSCCFSCCFESNFTFFVFCCSGKRFSGLQIRYHDKLLVNASKLQWYFH